MLDQLIIYLNNNFQRITPGQDFGLVRLRCPLVVAWDANVSVSISYHNINSSSELGVISFTLLFFHFSSKKNLFGYILIKSDSAQNYDVLRKVQSYISCIPGVLSVCPLFCWSSSYQVSEFSLSIQFNIKHIFCENLFPVSVCERESAVIHKSCNLPFGTGGQLECVCVQAGAYKHQLTR